MSKLKCFFSEKRQSIPHLTSADVFSFIIEFLQRSASDCERRSHAHSDRRPSSTMSPGSDHHQLLHNLFLFVQSYTPKTTCRCRLYRFDLFALFLARCIKIKNSFARSFIRPLQCLVEVNRRGCIGLRYWPTDQHDVNRLLETRTRTQSLIERSCCATDGTKRGRP